MLVPAPVWLRIGLLATFGLAPVAAQQGVVPAQVGEKVPDFEFPPFQNGDGRQQLADFAGQPVLIVFWSHVRDIGPRSHGLKEALATDRKLRGQGLVSLFVEASKAAPDDVQALLWGECSGFDGRVTVADLQMPLPEIQDPSVMLIGVDGRLLLVQKLERWYGDFSEDLLRELAKVANGWGDNAEIAKVRAALYGKGSFATARTLVPAVPDDKARERVLAEIEAVFARRVTAVEWLTRAGRLVDAKAAVEALQQGTTGAADLQERVAPLVAALATDAAKKALAVDQKLDKLLGKVRDGRFRGDLLHDLEPIAKAAKGTAVATRIAKLCADLQWLVQAGRR